MPDSLATPGARRADAGRFPRPGRAQSADDRHWAAGATAWSQRFGAAAPDVHVNIAGRQLESGNLTRDVLTALDTYGVSAGRLFLELTETRVPTIADSLPKDLIDLRERGIRIAIDDVGTGYSSLTRIANSPVDMLKIDIKLSAASA
jgi:EAL domain-containing protein (putative c-di-GMP-specific phosphodiesterase class I)